MSDMHDNDESRRSSGPNRTPGPPMRMSRGVLAWVVFILFSLMLVMMVMSNLGGKERISYDQFRNYLRDHNIAEVQIRDDLILGKLVDPHGKSFQVDILPGKLDLDKLVNVEFPELCPRATVTFDPNTGQLWPILINIVPWIFIFGLAWFFL